jgi:pilus assembly protein Flp/PilA
VVARPVFGSMAYNLAPLGCFWEAAMLAKLRNGLVNFVQSEDGPTAVEYAVMLALIIIVCLVTIQVLGSNANKAFDTVGQSIGTVTT